MYVILRAIDSVPELDIVLVVPKYIFKELSV